MHGMCGWKATSSCDKLRAGATSMHLIHTTLGEKYHICFSELSPGYWLLFFPSLCKDRQGKAAYEPFGNGKHLRQAGDPTGAHGTVPGVTMSMGESSSIHRLLAEAFLAQSPGGG